MTENGKKIKTERAFPAKMRGRLAAHFRKYRWNYLFSVLAVAVMWGVWVAAYFAVGNEYVVPSFMETMRELGALFASGTFWESFGGTLWRTVAGWLLAFAFAVLFAAAGVASKKFRSFFAPFVSVFRTLPTMAITLMLLIWSTPLVAPVIVTFLMLFPVTYAQLMAAYGEIDPQLFEMARVYGVPRREVLCKIAVPGMLPAVFSQAGPNLSLSLKVTISAEVLVSTFRSLGGMMHEAANYLQVAEMFALTILALLVGGLFEFALHFLTRITARWKGGAV